MEPFQTCSDVSDLTEFSLPQQLYLKPEAKISITVALPSIRFPGKTISNWEVMERLRQLALPDEFLIMKVNKSSLEFIRFDGEVENRSQIRAIISRIDGKSIRLSGFPEPLKVRAAEAKPEFPTKHDWDKYFRDAKNMNEMKPGERPDTVLLQGLPCKWFSNKRDRRQVNDLPNEQILQRVFEAFGEVRCVDIPMLDPYRSSMKASISGIRTHSQMGDAVFDAYVQYREYIYFVKAMDSLRGMKLVHIDGDKAFSSSLKVDFDKTKHLSDMVIRRRAVEREKLMTIEREKEEVKRREEDAVRRAIEEEERQKEEEKRLKGERRKEREEKRKQRILKKLKKKEAEQMNIKIAIEERKLLMAQRKLESIRLLDELFERVKLQKQRENNQQREKDRKEGKSRKKHKDIVQKDKEREMRKKLVGKIKSAQEQQMEERREKLKKTMEGRVKSSSLKAKDAADGVGYDFDVWPPFDPYSGYGYRDWIPRGMYRGRFFPRRPFRGYRGSFNQFQEWGPFRESEWPPSESKSTKKSAADDMEEISSDADSSATSKYSNLNSSNDDEEKTSVKKDLWPGYEATTLPDGSMQTHPWVGYSDYYNPRLMRRASRRPRGSFRGWPRGSFGGAPNPNVPMNSYYMQSINEQYYKYFSKLAKGEKEDNRSRSKSHSSERVVCRKVLSRSRSRGKSYSRSRSNSRSYSSSSSHGRSRSRSRSRSQSKPRSKEQRSRSKSKDNRSLKSTSKEKNVDEISDEKKPQDDVKPSSTVTKHPEPQEESDLSLSLSDSDDLSYGSPKRKVRPLGDPNWTPNERHFRRRRDFRGFHQFGRYNFDVRSRVTRPQRRRSRSRSRSRSRNRRRSRSNNRSRHSSERQSNQPSRSDQSTSRRKREPSPARTSDDRKSRDDSSKRRGTEKEKPASKDSRKASVSKERKRSHSKETKPKVKKEKKRKKKHHPKSSKKHEARSNSD